MLTVSQMIRLESRCGWIVASLESFSSSGLVGSVPRRKFAGVGVVVECGVIGITQFWVVPGVHDDMLVVEVSSGVVGMMVFSVGGVPVNMRIVVLPTGVVGTKLSWDVSARVDTRVVKVGEMDEVVEGVAGNTLDGAADDVVDGMEREVADELVDGVVINVPIGVLLVVGGGVCVIVVVTVIGSVGHGGSACVVSEVRGS